MPTAVVFLVCTDIKRFSIFVIVPRKTQSRVNKSALSPTIASKTDLRDCVCIVKIVQKVD